MSTSILAIETTTDIMSVALLHQDYIRSDFVSASRNHTQYLLPLVRSILLREKIRLIDLSALVFCSGPGSFTGIRIGISAIQGLAVGASLPVIGLSTLLTIAQRSWHIEGADQVLVAIDAKKGEIFWAVYKRDSQGNWLLIQLSERLLSPNEVIVSMESLEGEWFAVGDAWNIYPQIKSCHSLALNPISIGPPYAEDMIPLALQKWKRGHIIRPEDAKPTYLRDKIAWKKLADQPDR
jgi:tRNA threonylcarbamoyladenosine biosynthesis protein TsaB